jgi:hypothetical protein
LFHIIPVLHRFALRREHPEPCDASFPQIAKDASQNSNPSPQLTPSPTLTAPPFRNQHTATMRHYAGAHLFHKSTNMRPPISIPTRKPQKSKDLPNRILQLDTPRKGRFDASFPARLSCNFAVEVRRPSVAGSNFRLRFGCPGERGRREFRRNRAGELKSFRLGSPVKSGSLSPIAKGGWSAIGNEDAHLSPRVFSLRFAPLVNMNK